jgi:hypothetical protein
VGESHIPAQSAQIKTRYFYTDPLAVAWMNARHGFKFVTAEGELLWLLAKHCTFYGYEGAWVNPHDSARLISRAFPAYLHPDSLYLLEPQIGDLVEYGLHNATYSGAMPTTTDRVRWTRQMTPSGMRDIVHPDARYILCIIQRNGTAFMHPESEAA